MTPPEGAPAPEETVDPARIVGKYRNDPSGEVVEVVREGEHLSIRLGETTTALEAETNVSQVRGSLPLRKAAAELAVRAVDTWRVLDHHRTELERPMAKSGRKAAPIEETASVEE